MKFARPIAWLASAATAMTLAMAPIAPAQAQASAAWRTQAPYTQQELDQMLAPIALYPDALLAQVLMAATYPLEVVQAARFVQRNPGLGGDALERAVAPMGWDPSVAALTQFPSVLAMMNEELEWTQRLGEAVLAQREQVMDTVQALRAKAYAAGSLRSTEQQQVIVQERIILIEPWRPGLLWVPYYNPLIVFGTWWWPAYPPFLWVPPVIYRPPYFPEVYSIGIVWGPVTVILASLWNDPRPVWRTRPMVIDRVPVTNVIVTNATAPRPQVWHHDPAHRRSIGYRTPAVRDRYPSVPAPRVAPAPGQRVAPTPPQRERITPAPQRERERVTPTTPRREPVAPVPPQRERVAPTAPREPTRSMQREPSTTPPARPVPQKPSQIQPPMQRQAPVTPPTQGIRAPSDVGPQHRQQSPQRQPQQPREPQQRGPQ